MKAKTVFALSCMLIASMLLVVPVSAAKDSLEFKANGKLIHYANYQNPNRGAELVDGRWDIKIKDGEVDFKFSWKELNIREEIELSPAGTIDHFKGYLNELESYDVGVGMVEIWGWVTVDKKMWFLEEEPADPPDWYPDYPLHAPVDWIPEFMVRYAYIKITPDSIEIDFEDDGTNIYGTTLSYHD